MGKLFWYEQPLRRKLSSYRKRKDSQRVKTKKCQLKMSLKLKTKETFDLKQNYYAVYFILNELNILSQVCCTLKLLLHSLANL